MRNTLLPSVHRIESEVTALYDVASRLRAEVATLRQQLTDPSVAPGAQPGTDAAAEWQAQAALQPVAPQPVAPQPTTAAPQPASASSPPTVAAPPPPGAAPMPGAGQGFFAGRPGTPTSLPHPGQPAAQQGIATAYAPPPMPPRVAWWEHDGAITKVVAVAGAAMTLLGVAFFLLLAAQLGLLAPPMRIGLAAVAASALGYIAVCLHGRTAGAEGTWRRPGAWWRAGVAETGSPAEAGTVALAAVAFATLCADVVAATLAYEYLPAMVGVALVAVLTSLGLLLSRRWNSELFAVLSIVAFMLLTPWVGRGVSTTTVAFLVVIAAGAQVAHLGRSWLWVHVARAVVPVVVVGWAVLDGPAGETSPIAAAAWILALLGLVQAALAWRERGVARTAGDPNPGLKQGGVARQDWSSRLFRAVAGTPMSVLPHRRRDIRITSIGILWYAIPVIIMATSWTKAGAVYFAAAVAVIFGAAAMQRTSFAPSARAAAASVTVPGVLGVIHGVFTVDQGGPDWRVTSGALMAAVLFLAARHFRSAISAALAALYLFTPAMLALVAFPSMWSLSDAQRDDQAEGIATLAAVAVAWAACAWMLGAVRRSLPDFPLRRWMAVVLAVLAASTGVVLLGTNLTTSPMETDPSGYYLAHAVVTVVWASLGWWVLRGRVVDASPRWRRQCGLAVVAAVVAKLLLHDVQALDGLVRVAAFLGAGPFLLFMAVKGRALVADDVVAADAPDHSPTPPANG